jgi:ketosteroid isomerase-like protein
MRKLDSITAVLVLPLLIFSPGCQRSKVLDYNKEKELIITAIHSSIGWAGNKDIKLLYSVIANDTAFLEIHPGNKVVKSFDEFRKAENFWMDPAFKPIRYEIKDLSVSISESGTVAWWFCMLDDINEWKGEPSNWENTRWTGVMEKRNGKWKILQQHFSFAVLQEKGI